MPGDSGATWSCQGRGKDIPRAGVGVGAAKASSSDGFDWQNPRISVFPSVKQKEEQAGVEDEP